MNKVMFKGEIKWHVAGPVHQAEIPAFTEPEAREIFTKYYKGETVLTCERAPKSAFY